MEVALESRGWKSFKMNVRKSLHCCEWTVQGNSGDPGRKESGGESLSVLREYLSNPEQNVGRYMGCVHLKQ